MATIQLSDELIAEARTYSQAYHRSIPKQIEYWSRIGKIAEENPDMPFAFIQEILLSKQQMEDGNVTEYDFNK